MDDRNLSPWKRRIVRKAARAGFILTALAAFSLGVVGGCPTLPAAASSDNAKPDVELKEGDRRLLPSLMGATPEEQARLTEERKRLSATAAANGTDPTAIVGYNQLAFGSIRLHLSDHVTSN